MSFEHKKTFSVSPVSAALQSQTCPKTKHAERVFQRENRWLNNPSIQSLSLVLTVFVIDLSLPLGVASAVPYTFAVLLALRTKPGWFGPFVAALCMVLTLAKMAIVPDRGSTELWKVVVNRCLAIFAIGMTTLLGILRRKSDQERDRSNELLREHQASLAHLGRLSLLGQVTASLAHELNQPLAAVRLNAEIAERFAARQKSLGPELTSALIEVVSQSARAGEIVHSIRRLAKRSSLNRLPIAIHDIISTVVNLLEWNARKAEVAIEVLPVDPKMIALGDPIQIEQVLFNLLQNAIESLDPETKRVKAIQIRVSNDADMIVLHVRDNGPGIVDAARVFEPFYSTKSDGLGLGLAICRGIIESHRGKISAVAVEEGGTEFTFSIPAVRKEDA